MTASYDARRDVSARTTMRLAGAQLPPQTTDHYRRFQDRRRCAKRSDAANLEERTSVAQFG
jgi:hypothetical protein